MSETGKQSIFYGGGRPSGGSTGSSNVDRSVPFSGDPLDDLIASFKINAGQEGYSEEDIKRRFENDDTIPITVNGGEIMLGPYALEDLDPDYKAFYILLVNHPAGLRVKDLQSDYLEEFLSIEKSVQRKRAKSYKQKQQDASVDLAKRAPKYRVEINKTITELEKKNGNVNLSSCKVFGGKGKPYAILSLLHPINEGNYFLKEL